MDFIVDTVGDLNTDLKAFWWLRDLLDDSGNGKTLRQWGNRDNSVPHANPCTFTSGERGEGYASFVGTSGTVWQGLLVDQSGGSNNPVSTKLNDFSFFAFLKIPPAESSGAFFHNGNISATNEALLTGWQVGYGLNGNVSVDGSGNFSCTFLGRDQKFSNTAINAGKWTGVGFSFDEDQLFTINVNGVDVGTVDFDGYPAMKAPNLVNTNGGTEIGISSFYPSIYSGQHPFTGDMRMVGVWDRTLSTQNFYDLWHNGIINLAKQSTYKDVLDILEMRTGIFDKKNLFIKQIDLAINEIFARNQNKHFYQRHKRYSISGSANPYAVDLSLMLPFPKSILNVTYIYGSERKTIVPLTPNDLENISQLTEMNSNSIYYNNKGDSLELFFGSSFEDVTDNLVDVHVVRQPNTDIVTLTNYSTVKPDILDCDVKELTEVVFERMMN